MSGNESLPRGILYAGDEANGNHSYVGRCEYDGGVYPAKIIPTDGAAYCKFNSGGQMHCKIFGDLKNVFDFKFLKIH